MKNLRFFIPLLFLTTLAPAKSADDYFHGAGYKYIAGKHQEASVEADEGMRAHPEDTRLQELAGLLKKMKDQQKQDQNQEGGGGSDQDKKEEQDKKDQSKDQKGKDSKNEKPEDKQQDKSASDSTGQDEKKPAEQADQKPPQDSSGGDSKTAEQRPKPGQMSKEEAEQLLNSFADDEKKEQRKLRAHPGKQPQVEQDW